MCKQKERIHVATHHRKPPPCFAKTAGRENPTEPGAPGPVLGQWTWQLSPWHSQRTPAAVPMTLTVFVRQQGRREDLRWVGRWFNRQEADPAIPDALPGFVYLALWYFSLAVNFLYQGRGGEKRLLFFNKPWERNTRKTPRPQHFGFTSSQLSATQQLRILTTTCWRDSDGKSQSVSRGESAARYSGR